MLTDRDCDEAARLLDGLWREGRQADHLPQALRPASRAEGYAVQARLEACSAHPPAGWKIAATSVAGQRHINVSGPLAGRIFTERLLKPGATVSLKGNNMRVAELEFGFRLGRDLPPRAGGYSPAEVEEAVEALVPSVEIPASRYTDFCAVGEAALIADNSCAAHFVWGEDFDPADWRGRDLSAAEVEARVDGKPPVRGIGRNVLGDPWIGLNWLVNECSAHGMGLMRGQVISTGTCLVPVAVSEGDRLTADFGMGRQIALTFA